MKYFYLLWIAGLVISCKPKKTDYSIKGRLVNGCDGSPVKNQKVQAIQMNAEDGFNASAISDANGDFEVLVSSAEKVNYRFMNLQEEVPLETVDYGEIPLYSNSLFYYRIQVTNPHGAQDSLWIVAPEMTNKFYLMRGPFHDTVIGLRTFTAINTLVYNARTKRLNPSNTTNTVRAWYKINRTSYAATKSVEIAPAVCNTVADTLTLIVD